MDDGDSLNLNYTCNLVKQTSLKTRCDAIFETFADINIVVAIASMHNLEGHTPKDQYFGDLAKWQDT